MLNPIAALLIEVLEIYKWIVIAAVIVSWLTAFNVINQYNNFVRTLLLVSLGEHDRIARVAKVHELRSFDDAAILHIQARNYAMGQHHSTLSETDPLVLTVSPVSISASRSAMPSALKAASTT